MELFSQTENEEAPLAFRMRPRNIDEFIGQDHIAAPGRLLRRIIQADRMSSIIFYGPPGTGKTTLARVIANTTSSSFITMNAVLDGVKNLREGIAEAQSHRDLYGRRTILFVDEVHRWNKSQQDALLPWVENGTVILIGATTENPYFEVNKALVSRSRIFQLKPLTEKNLYDIAMQAINDTARGYGRFEVSFEEGALEHLIKTANGDARSLLNAVELAVETSAEDYPPQPDTPIRVSMDAAEESIQKKALLYDKEGDYHYDTISAFIKSIRGSDPDAALYWLATMVRAGEEPRYIFRRMLISASEDIGLADPQALGVVESAAAAFDRVGLPEGRFHLAQAALYLATAPKSNTTLAFFDALGAVEQEFAKEVPNHLKDSGRDKAGFGHGEGYLYPHAYKDHWVAQQYLPAGLQGRIFYEPTDRGFEAGIKTIVEKRREIQLSSAVQPEHEEVLTFSPPDKAREHWLKQVSSNAGKTLDTIREDVFSALDIRRHECILVLENRPPVLLWEAVRKTPEGGTWYCPSSERAAEIAGHLEKNLPEEIRPHRLAAGSEQFNISELLSQAQRFDHVILSDILTRDSDKTTTVKAAAELLSDDGRLLIHQIIPSSAQRLSEITEVQTVLKGETALFEALQKAESEVYSDESNPLVNWTADDIVKASEVAGLAPEYTFKSISEPRIISEADINRWFGTEGSYGKQLEKFISEDENLRLKKLVSQAIANERIPWNMTFLRLNSARKR